MMSANIVSKEQWLEARKGLLAQEKALTRQQEEIANARRQLPWVEIDRNYMFEGETGPISLADLFGSNSQLIVYHFMYGPEWEAPCRSCSFWADNFNGIQAHLSARDIAFAAVSRAPIGMLREFRKRMNWQFTWVSSNANSFNADFDVSFGSDHNPENAVFYNFHQTHYPADEAHGTSVFAKDESGTIYHTYSTYGRGLEITNCAYSYIDLTPKGRQEPDEGNPMHWVKYHDQY